MITLDDALQKLGSPELTAKVVEMPISEAFGMVLAEDVYSDVNMPPFNKSAMDGYACKEEDLAKELVVVDYIPAGSLPNKSIDFGQCAKIMTGSKVPEGADCVIMVEHTREVAKGKIVFTGKGSKSNICSLGEDVKTGDVVLRKGSVLNPASIGIAASVGKSILHVYAPPRVTILATGDELVEVEKAPEGAMIRNSNSYNLLAQLKQTPALASYGGIVSDSKDDLSKAIKAAFENCDLLILTGGVSMGDKDYVPEILAELGMKVEYDKVAIQPGKPTAFAHGNGKFCFGLSGNPVSSLLQFELLTKPFIYSFMQHNYTLPLVNMKLNKEKNRKKTERQQFFPIQLVNGEAQVLEFHGSAHLSGLVNADGFAIFEQGKATIEEGEEVRVLLV